MGGKIFEDTVPMNADELQSLKDFVFGYLHGTAEVVTQWAPREKDEFGDLDLYTSDEDFRTVVGALAVHSSVKEVIRNGDNSVSFKIEHSGVERQVDLMSTPNLDFTQRYYSGGDLGNALSRHAEYALGLKLTASGLYYIQRSRYTNEKIKEYTVTLNWDHALTLLGYIPSSWNLKVLHDRSYDAIRDFLIKGSLFDARCLSLTTSNARFRKRYNKRSHFRALVDSLKTLVDEVEAYHGDVDEADVHYPIRMAWLHDSPELRDEIYRRHLEDEVDNKFRGHLSPRYKANLPSDVEIGGEEHRRMKRAFTHMFSILPNYRKREVVTQIELFPASVHVFRKNIRINAANEKYHDKP